MWLAFLARIHPSLSSSKHDQGQGFVSEKPACMGRDQPLTGMVGATIRTKKGENLTNQSPPMPTCPFSHTPACNPNQREITTLRCESSKGEAEKKKKKVKEWLRPQIIHRFNSRFYTPSPKMLRTRLPTTKTELRCRQLPDRPASGGERTMRPATGIHVGAATGDSSPRAGR